MTQGPLVVLVGHCGPDAAMLRRIVSRVEPAAAFTSVNTGRDLPSAVAGATLLLVNRKLDGAFSAADGIELMRGLPRAPAWMLISNYPDAQASAVSAGALPGFGKSGLYEPATTERLRAALAGHAGRQANQPEGIP